MEQIADIARELFGPALGTGGIVGAFLYFRKYDKELRQEIRGDNKALREENDHMRSVIHKQDAEIYRLNELIRKGPQ